MLSSYSAAGRTFLGSAFGGRVWLGEADDHAAPGGHDANTDQPGENHEANGDPQPVRPTRGLAPGSMGNESFDAVPHALLTSV